MKVKQNDTVLLLAGKERGKTGKVLKVNSAKGKVTVEKVNVVTKHVKKTETKQGGMIKFEMPIDASNVKVVCPHCGKAVRVGYQVSKDGKKVRMCKKCEGALDVTVVTKKK